MAENKDIRQDETQDLKAAVSLKDAQVVRFEMDICTDDVCYRIRASNGKLVVEPGGMEMAEIEPEAEPEQKVESKEQG